MLELITTVRRRSGPLEDGGRAALRDGVMWTKTESVKVGMGPRIQISI